MPNDFQKQQNNKERFNSLLDTINNYFQEKRLNGILQQIDDFFAKPFFQPGFPIKIYEIENKYVVNAQLPGVDKEHIFISIADNNLTISINDNPLAHENNVSTNKRSRTIPFPNRIDKQKVTATYKNGLLVIKINKEPVKQIKID